MILYADVYILINALCNWIALWLCAEILSLRKKKLRIAVTAVAMSLYSLAVTLFAAEGVLLTVFNIAVPVCGCFAAFGNMSALQAVKTFLVFFSACLMLGGIAGWISGVSGIQAVIIVFLTPVIYFVWSEAARVFGSKKNKKLLSVVIDGCRLAGFADSGNLLYDSADGLYVIVANGKKLNIDQNISFGFIKAETVCGTEYIPYYLPEYVEIERRKVYAAVAIDMNDSLKYDCIVPTELVDI